MKKVLALVVAFALCFTVFAGCFATSAADVAELTTFTVTSEPVAADAGAAKVTVTADLSTVKNVKLISVTLPADVDFVTEGEVVVGMKELTKDDDEGHYVINGKTIKFLEIQEVEGAAFVADINVTVPVNTEEAVATYTVEAFIEYADFDYNYGTATAEGVVTVKAAKPEHVCAAVNYTDNGDGTHDGVCDCEDATVVADNEAHSAGLCACGLDSDIVKLDPQVEISSTINVVFRATKATTTDKYASCKMVVSTQKYNKTTLMKEPYSTPLVLSDYTKKNNAATYYDISSYELDLPMVAYVVCYDANNVEVAHSAPSTYVPSEILKGMYKSDATLVADTTRNTIITEILNLGAAAQTYFGNNAKNSDLDNATAMNKDFVGSPLSSYGELENVANPQWNTNNPPFTSTSNNITKATDIAGAPAIRYSILNSTSAGKNPLDFSKLKLEVSYTTLYNTESGNPEVVSDVIEGDDWNQYVDGKHLRYTFKKLAMYDSNKVITAVVTYDDVEVYSETYSIDSYILEYMGNADMTDVLTALAKFNVAARNYFSADGSIV